MSEHELRREHPAPGLTEQVETVADLPVVDKTREFVDEQLDRPVCGGGVGVVTAAPAADLVVVVHRPAVGGQLAESAQIVVRHARPSVEDDERQGARPGGGRGGALIPGLGLVRVLPAPFGDEKVHGFLR